MYRNAIKEMERWLYSENRKPLIVWGARQVGKTYLIKEIFAKTFFPEKSIYIDFRLESSIREFCMDTVNPVEIMQYISAVKQIPDINSSNLLIFDEVQECPAIITALKYFCQDFRDIAVIATGSMVRTKLTRMQGKRGRKTEQEFLFPVGKINQITLYPMTFDEFLLNCNRTLYNHVTSAYRNRHPLEVHMHQLAIDTLYKFLLIGGMPEAVQTFIETGSYYESGKVIKDLYDNYLSDMQLYQASPESEIRSIAIFKNIYTELNRESKNFKSSVIEPKKKTRDMRSPIDWLLFAHVIYRSARLKEHITIPLIEDNPSIFRLYLADIGLFSYQSGMNAASFISKSQRNTLSGIFFENYVAAELSAKGLPLFYWTGKNSAEMEFIVESNGNIYPIDVKKSRGTLNSLEKFRNHNSCSAALKFSENNYGFDREHGILTIPLYQVFLVAEYLSSGQSILPD